MERHLRPCPDSPNCASSQDPDPARRVDPLPIEGDPGKAWANLRALVESLPRTAIVEADGHYLHATFRTRWLRFTDDVEFLLDPTAGVIHLRSASRLGHSDFGTNRRRLEALRAAWNARTGPPGAP